MNTQKFIVSGIVGGIVSFLAGYLIYGLLLMDYFAKNAGSATGVNKPMTDILWWALIVGSLFWGLLYSYIFNRWANIVTLGAGMSAGFVIGLIMTAAFDFTMYGVTNIMTLNGTLVDIVCGAVIGALIGGAVGLMNGMGRKTA